MTPAFRRVRFPLTDGVMAGLAFGDETRPVDIVFVHATGMNARAYATLLAPLGERFHVLAVDLRGHGQSDLPPRMWSYTSWNRHRDDLIQLLDRYAAAPVTLAGHSLGGTASLLVGGRRPDLVGALALIDPVILAETSYRMYEMPLGTQLALRRGIARAAKRRRGVFPSREEAWSALHRRGFFRTFPDEVFADYLADGLIDLPEGGVRLACLPRFEAATFAAQRNDPWSALARYEKPLVLLRAEIGSTCSTSVAARIKERRPDLRMAVVEGATHALPMERPDRARAALETAIVMAQNGVRFRDLT